MKSYKTFKTEEPNSLDEALNVSKLKRLNLVSDEEFSQFRRVMRKMDAEKPITLKEKDSIMKVFNELINVILGDQSVMTKIAKKRKQEDSAKSEFEKGK